MVEVARPVNVPRRILTQRVERVLDPDRLVAGATLERLEEIPALLVRLRQDVFGLLDIVLERALLACVEAAADAEHEQHQDEQARADRDRATHEERLAISRRSPDLCSESRCGAGSLSSKKDKMRLLVAR